MTSEPTNSDFHKLHLICSYSCKHKLQGLWRAEKCKKVGLLAGESTHARDPIHITANHALLSWMKWPREQQSHRTQEDASKEKSKPVKSSIQIYLSIYLWAKIIKQAVGKEHTVQVHQTNNYHFLLLHSTIQLSNYWGGSQPWQASKFIHRFPDLQPWQALSLLQLPKWLIQSFFCFSSTGKKFDIVIIFLQHTLMFTRNKPYVWALCF